MNQFEFMRNITFGQYLPLDSIIHRSDPRARLFAYFAVLAAVTFASQIEGLILGWVFFMTGLVVAKISPLYALRGLLPPMPFLLIIVVLQIFIIPPDPVSVPVLSVGSFSITGNQLLAAFRLLIRFCCFVTGISLSALTLSTTQLIHGLGGLMKPFTRFGLPINDLILMVQITLHFIPLGALTAERIAKAQAARGAEWQSSSWNIIHQARKFVPVLVPLFITSLQRAETIAIAMEARGYSSTTHRTNMIEYRLGWFDFLLIVSALLVVALIVIPGLLPVWN